MAAGGGSIDGSDIRQLVAAGVTMLQRCAPLVRALAGGRGALLLARSSDHLVAMAACEGHGAVLLDPEWSAERVREAIEISGARVVFTRASHVPMLPAGVALVSLDELPGHVLFSHGSVQRRIDVGSHFGLTIEGEESEGSDEDAVIELTTGANGVTEPRRYTHRSLLAAARAVVLDAGLGEADVVSSLVPLHEAAGLTGGLIAPALAGARILSVERSRVRDAARAIEASGGTVLIADARGIEEMARALVSDDTTWANGPLRTAVAVGPPLDAATAELWQRATGAALLHVAPPQAHSL
jgi:acyl-CoA synthetase (AMP-forming)/AMP-acid ligase II